MHPCHSYRSGHADRPGINTHTTNTQQSYNTHTLPCTHRKALSAKEIFVCKLRMIAQVFLQSDWQTRLHLEWPPVPLLARSFSTRSQFIITTATTRTRTRKSSMNAVGQDNQMSASISAFRQLSSLLCPPGATVNWKLKDENSTRKTGKRSL